MIVSVDLEQVGAIQLPVRASDALPSLVRRSSIGHAHLSSWETYGSAVEHQWRTGLHSGIVRTIVGDSKPGHLLAYSGGTDAVLASSKPGGFYSCFPDLVAWYQLYMKGLGLCPCIDVFWKACSDAGVEFSPLGVAGYDEDLDRPLSTNQAFDELVRRIHFHWFYSNSSAYDVATPADEWTIRLSVPAGLALTNSPVGPHSFGQRRSLGQPICNFGRG